MRTHDYTKDPILGPIKKCPKCGKPGFCKGLPKAYIHKINIMESTEDVTSPVEVVEVCYI
jgi:hypothetical protein